MATTPGEPSPNAAGRPALFLAVAVLMFAAGAASMYFWMQPRTDRVAAVPPTTMTAPSPAAAPVAAPSPSPVEPPSPAAEAPVSLAPAVEPAAAPAPGGAPASPPAAGAPRPARPRARPGAPAPPVQVAAAAPAPEPASLPRPPAVPPRFVMGSTDMESLKPLGGALHGFDLDGVGIKRAPTVDGQLDLVMEPPPGGAGQPYAVRVYLRNTGNKAIKLDGMNVSMVVDGQRSTRPMPPKVKEVKPQQRLLLEELPGTWKDGMKNWTVEVAVTSKSQDVYRNRLSWQ